MPRAAWATVALALGLAPIAARAQAPLGASLPSGTRPAQWRVIWHEDPAHTATIAWSTDEAGASTLRFDTAPRGGRRGAYAGRASCTSGRYTVSLDHFHHCPLTALTPSTRYYFVMETAGEVSPERYFVTAPADPSARFKLLFGGDSRSDPRRRRAMNAALARMVADDPEILALAHGGDYIGRGTSWRQWSRWLSDHELTTGADGRVLPVIPARGNHEAVGALFGEVWAAPKGSDDYFATTIGRFVLVTLNTETTQAGDQRAWLERTLTAADGRARWITAQYHRPAFPAVKAPSGARMHWVPLFEAYDVDLVFESDGHVLKRTVPIRGGAPDPTGVVYVGEGGLGVALRTPDRRRWYLAPPGFASSAHHVQKLTVTEDALGYEAIAPDGAVLDRYTASPRARGVRRPAAASKRAAPAKPVAAKKVAAPPKRASADGCRCASPAPSGGVGVLLSLLGLAGLGRRRRGREPRRRAALRLRDS